MSTSLVLRRTPESGALVPTTLSGAFAGIARAAGLRATLHGHAVRVALALPLDDDACAAFPVDFVRQGARVTGTARGPGAALLQYCFHALADSLGCALDDPEDGEVDPDPESFMAGATAYVKAHEAGVVRDRAGRTRGAKETPEPVGPTGADFVAWLAREEHVALAPDASFDEELPLDDPEALYEALLESDAVEDIFVGETELTALLRRWRARAG